MFFNQLVTTPGSAPSAAKILELDPETFRANFNRKPYLVKHNLVGHPLFTLPSLIELSKRLPERLVEYYAGKVPVSIDWHLTPRNGLSIEETIRRIEEHCSWLVLKRVDHDQACREVLDPILDEVQALSEPLDPKMQGRAGAIFVSSPGALTPYHMDREYNFLFQFRGTKVVHVFDANDRSLLSEEELEDHFTKPSINRNLVFREEYQKKAFTFELKPGYALHVPSLFPHWVQNGDNVSISFSAGFDTQRSIRRAILHEVNHKLRGWGLKPSPVGRSPVRDGITYAGYAVCHRLNKLCHRR